MSRPSIRRVGIPLPLLTPQAPGQLSILGEPVPGEGGTMYAPAQPADGAWSSYHRDFRTVIDGVRFVLALDPATGGTVLRPWRDPKAVK